MDGIFLRYIMANTRRMLKLFPAILAGTSLLCISILAAAHIIIGGSVEEERRKLVVAVVGDFSNSFFDSGVEALQSLDATRYIIELEPVSRTEAEEGYAEGRYISYIIIPDGFMDSVRNGRNDKKLEYVYGDDVQDIIGRAMAEIVESFSEYVTGSQSGIYAAGRANYELGNGDLTKEQLVDINTRYITSVLGRENMCEEEKTGISDSLSTTAYYFCGILVFFIMLTGINSCMYFNRRSRSLRLYGISRGCCNIRQLISEYIPFFLVGICIVICAWIFLSVSVLGHLLVIDEWADNQLANLWLLMPGIIPVVLFITIIQFLMYEITDDIVGGILLQFIFSVCIGYISGCFYPIGFFPKLVQTIAGILPAGVARSYIAACISGKETGISLLIMFVYMLICAALIYGIRNRTVNKSVSG